MVGWIPASSWGKQSKTMTLCSAVFATFGPLAIDGQKKIRAKKPG